MDEYFVEITAWYRMEADSRTRAEELVVNELENNNSVFSYELVKESV